MGTKLRATLSKKNKYYIEKHRYYELKHFCLQYPIWKQAYLSITDDAYTKQNSAIVGKVSGHSDPTAKCVEAKMFYYEKLSLIEKISYETSNDLTSFILIGVTEGYPYEHLKMKLNIPCCKDTYYELYRKFFWLLNKARN